MRTAALLLAGAGALALGGCGGGGNGAASCTPATTASLTITAAGVSPTNVCVQPQGQVTFTNNDTVAHHIEFDTAGCPAVPEIAAGAQATATFNTAENCSFHDGNNASNAFRGTVAVTAVTVTGGGY
jgi:plastocyanin